MTSRVSFHKLIIETLRRHLAAMLITALAFFIHVIAFFMNIQNILNVHVISETEPYGATVSELEYAIEHITELCSPNMWNAILTMFISAYLAFDFFKYMHSKKETDFYESLPIRKQTWFKTLLIASIGIFVLFATVSIGLELAIVYGLGYGSAIILQNMLWSLICMIGIFLACWTMTVLTMILTGHPIVAFLGLGIFVSYIPLIISNLIPFYSNEFFDTYVYRNISPIYYYFSPVTLAYKVTHHWNYNSELWNISEHWTYLLGCFIFALVVGIIAYLLFLRRPSETAGRAMAFEKTNPIIRILIVIPFALYAGLLLNEIAAYASFIWLLFGVIFVACLIHGIMECIFQFDIKALLSKKRQLLFTILFCLGFVFVFWADIFQYDQYMPDAQDVKSVQIDTDLFGDNTKGGWDEHKDWLTGESVEDALAVIKDIREHTQPDNAMHMNTFTVTYELKNGTEKQRRYSYYGNEFPESLNKLSATEDFKDDFCVLYHLDALDITSISVANGPEYFELNGMTEEQKKELCEIYLKEYTEFTLTECLSKQVLFELVVEYPVEGEEHAFSDRYFVYSDFTETIAYLEKYNIVSFADSHNIKLENLEIYSDKYEAVEPQYISDEQQLNELKQYMILGEFMHYSLDYGDDFVSCSLCYVLDGNTGYMDVYLKPTDISNVLNK